MYAFVCHDVENFESDTSGNIRKSGRRTQGTSVMYVMQYVDDQKVCNVILCNVFMYVCRQ